MGGSFSLAEPSATVARMLSMTSLDRAWLIYPSVAAALAAVVADRSTSTA
jgi:hypothetical protein